MKAGSVTAGALCAAALLATLLGGCGLFQPRPTGGNAAVREETRGGLQYRLRSEVSPRRATLGDPVRWTLIAELPRSVTPGPLVLDSAGLALEVKPRTAPHRGEATNGGRWTWTQDVRGFDLGPLPLPAARIAVSGQGVRDSLFFPPDTLAIDSLTQARADSLLPDRGPVPAELRPIDYAVAAGLLLAALAILWATIAAVRRARARKRELLAEAAVPTPADEAYRLALAALRESGETLSFDVFYERLSGAIRDYAAAVTGVPARDRTTTEIEREVKATGAVGREGTEALVSALRRADLVKFARIRGGWEEARAALAEAERLPERLPLPSPPSPAPAAPPSLPSAPGSSPLEGA
jgi:hypothetical protein